MGKRSRDVSCSPSADTTSSPTKSADAMSDPESKAPPTKLKGEHGPPLTLGAMQCSLPPHRDVLDFASIDDFEIHYAKEHTNRCISCGKNLPTAHFLALHIDENHNVLREALQAKGEKTYSCFVEDCDRQCSTPQKRRLHLIDKHMFPKAYNFHLVDTGIDCSTTMLREGQKRRLSTTNGLKGGLVHRWRTSSSRTMDKGEDLTLSDAAAQGQEGLGGKHIAPGTMMPAASRRPPPALKSEAQETASGSIDVLERSLASLRFVPTSVLKKQAKP